MVCGNTDEVAFGVISWFYLDHHHRIDDDPRATA